MQLKETTLRSFLEEALKQARMKRGSQLVSWTEKMEPLSLVQAFDQVEPFHLNRLFWSNNEQTFMLFGFGTAMEIVATENRFKQLDEKWSELVRNASIYNPYEAEGTGLTAFGGMSFDPLRERSELWKNFPVSQLTVPAYLVVYVNGEYYFTMNRLIDEETDIHLIAQDKEAMKRTLSGEKRQQTDVKQKIIYKMEKNTDKWMESVKKAVKAINNDKAEKIVLARELRIKLKERVNVGSLIEKLMETQKQSYIFAYEQGDDCFVGASPERLVRLKGADLLSTCLAGTAPRGNSEAEDAEIADELLNDAKNRKEHDHVVKMIRSSIEPFCFNINIPDQPVILTLRNLQHLYTPVTAKLKNGVTVFQLIEVLHPTPALGGVPRDTALEFIREEEQFDRGWYGAPIGWVDYHGNSEFAVAIRSGLVQGDEVSLFAGCGVMGDSDPEIEYQETAVKFLPMLTILEDRE